MHFSEILIKMRMIPGLLGTCINLRIAMPEYDVLEADTNVDVSKLINQRAQQGWKLISLHVTERSNGSPRYTVLVARN
jgi:hypothetical protein